VSDRGAFNQILRYVLLRLFATEPLIAQLKDLPYAFGFRPVHHQAPAFRSDVVAEHRDAANAFPLRRAADSLSRVRSLIISRSNCANESRIFKRESSH